MIFAPPNQAAYLFFSSIGVSRIGVRLALLNR
jgi:hypothetical protein